MNFFKKIFTRVLLRITDLDLIKSFLEETNHNTLVRQSIIKEGAKFYTESRITNMQSDRQKIQIGQESHIRGHLQIFMQGGQIKIGDYCYVGESSNIWSALSITIGSRVLIAHNVNIHDNISHPLDSDARHKDYLRILGLHKSSANDFDLRPKAVEIGDDVWIGFNSTILKGVTIGQGAIIGACSVVTKDVSPWTVVAGNPARVIKQLK